MGRFPGSDHDAYRAGVSGNAEEIPDIYMGIEYFTLSDFNPVIFFEPESGALKYFWLFLNNRIFQLILLLLLSLLRLSSGVIGLLGKRTNPSLILAGSFFLIICIGTGLLMLPRCTVDGISWVNALFVSTSAVCVTGLVPVDVATTFTSLGQLVIIILIQIGGLGVMTLTCFFAMFFMGNTSVYNQLAVRDMISSDSLSSLLSTVIYILFFTLVIEGAGDVGLVSEYSRYFGDDGATGNGVCCFSFYFGFL